MKKVWQKPELIILLKGKPEEAVLTQCKTEKFGVAEGTDASGQACGNNLQRSCNPCLSRGGGGS